MRVEELPFAAHVEHAYTPRETATHGGKEHIVVDEYFELGRLKRSAGNPLCKARRSFWGLHRCEADRTPTCKRCIEIAERVLPAAQPDQCGGSGGEFGLDESDKLAAGGYEG